MLKSVISRQWCDERYFSYGLSDFLHNNYSYFIFSTRKWNTSFASLLNSNFYLIQWLNFQRERKEKKGNLIFALIRHVRITFRSNLIWLKRHNIIYALYVCCLIYFCLLQSAIIDICMVENFHYNHSNYSICIHTRTLICRLLSSHFHTFSHFLFAPFLLTGIVREKNEGEVIKK